MLYRHPSTPLEGRLANRGSRRRVATLIEPSQSGKTEIGCVRFRKSRDGFGGAIDERLTLHVPGSLSHLHAGPELNDASRRYQEVVGGGDRVPRHECVEPLLPSRQVRS